MRVCFARLKNDDFKNLLENDFMDAPDYVREQAMS